jgi:HlyD family secretion protein
VATDAVRSLEKDLARAGSGRWLRRLVVFALLVAAGVGAYAAREATKPPPLPRFSEKAVARRDVVQEVQSTGKVKPLTEVQVGAQVTGRVVKVLVDFNSTVKKGDLLAEIDPQLFGAQVSQVPKLE